MPSFGVNLRLHAAIAHDASSRQPPLTGLSAASKWVQISLCIVPVMCLPGVTKSRDPSRASQHAGWAHRVVMQAEPLNPQPLKAGE